MALVVRKGGLKVWVYRWFEPGPDGRPHRSKKVIGPVTRFPREAAAWEEVNRLGLGLTFDQFGPKNLRELAAHYRKTELTEDDNPDGLAFSTKDCNRNYLRNWIEPRWGDYPLCDVKAVEVEKWLRSLAQLAPGTKKKIRDVMHVLFEHAIRYEWIDRNPITSVRQGGKRQAVPELISVEDLSRLIFGVLGLRERVMVFLDFGTGLRRGELSGLKWEDVDFERGQLHPKRSIVRQHIGPTKTEASRKPIPLDDHLLGDLRKWRAQTPYAQDEDYIFASPKTYGKQPYWLESIVKRQIKPAAKKHGIYLKGWHTLRHTYSTLLRANGSDPKVVQELLRHASLKVTMDTYTQALSPEKRQAHREVIRLVVPRQAPQRSAGAL